MLSHRRSLFFSEVDIPLIAFPSGFFQVFNHSGFFILQLNLLISWPSCNYSKPCCMWLPVCCPSCPPVLHSFLSGSLPGSSTLHGARSAGAGTGSEASGRRWAAESRAFCTEGVRWAHRAKRPVCWGRQLWSGVCRRLLGYQGPRHLCCCLLLASHGREP